MNVVSRRPSTAAASGSAPAAATTATTASVASTTRATMIPTAVGRDAATEVLALEHGAAERAAERTHTAAAANKPSHERARDHLRPPAPAELCWRPSRRHRRVSDARPPGRRRASR